MLIEYYFMFVGNRTIIMEKIAAKILKCDLEKCGDSTTTIKMYVDYGCQQFVTVSNKVDLSKFLDFFDTYKLSDIAGKHCYVIMKSVHSIVELQQFPCHGYDILTLETGEIISEFDRDRKAKLTEENKNDLVDELAEIKLKQSSPKSIRKQILNYFRKFGDEGILKRDLLYYLNSNFSSKYKSKVIEQEFQKLLKENKILGWGNTRAKRYANAKNYRKLCELK